MIMSDLMGYFVNMVRSNCAGLSMEQNQFDALLSAAYNHGNVNACPLKYYLQGTLSAQEAYTCAEEQSLLRLRYLLLSRLNEVAR